MKKILSIFVLIFLITGTILLYPTYIAHKQSKIIAINSPLPQLLTKSFPRVLGINSSYWQPVKIVLAKNPEFDEKLTAVSALTYDLTTNQLIYAKNPEIRLPIASLTKIMTAVVALQNYHLDQEFTVSKNASEVGEDSMGLSENETLTLKDLLHGLLMSSGNDAAETIAQGSRFGRENFVFLMNQEAEEMGLLNTHFTNPSGLEGDGKQYSTAFDLLTVTRLALQNPDFADTVATYDYSIPETTKHKGYQLYNETNLLTTYPGVKGVKTGFTNEAGLCLITYLDYDGHKIIAVLLNAQNRREEMKELLDYSLKSIGVKPPAHG